MFSNVYTDLSQGLQHSNPVQQYKQPHTHHQYHHQFTTLAIVLQQYRLQDVMLIYNQPLQLYDMGIWLTHYLEIHLQTRLSFWLETQDLTT